MIDLVGYLGTRFGYATHLSQVARALKAEGLLGRVHNLDPGVHDDYQDLINHFVAPLQKAVLVIALPAMGVEAFAHAYPKRALFVCPNTDALSEDHVAACALFDRLIVPSEYCRQTVDKAVNEPVVSLRAPPARSLKEARQIPVVRLGLGIDPIYVERRAHTRDLIRRRLDQPPRVLHFTTDGFWPGRKGTEELIRAWAELHDEDRLSGAQLTLHVPEDLQHAVYYACADRGLYEPLVHVIAAERRGEIAERLWGLMVEHDLIVQPSRAEGFGMVILAAFASGVPLLTTNITGQRDFLRGFGGLYYQHVDVTERSVLLAGEHGCVPELDERQVKERLRALLDGTDPEAARPYLLRELGEAEEAELGRVLGYYSWPEVAVTWVDWIKRWLAGEETNTWNHR